MILEGLSDYYYSLGLHLAKHSNMTRGIEALKKAVSLQPSYWKAWNVLGLCLYRTGDFKPAREAWENSISIYNDTNENSAAYYIDTMHESSFTDLCNKYNTALFHAKQNNFKEASQILQSKDFNDCQIVKFLNLCGLCKFAQGRRKEAMKIWDTSLQIDIDNRDTIRYITKTSKEISEGVGILKSLMRLTGWGKVRN